MKKPKILKKAKHVTKSGLPLLSELPEMPKCKPEPVKPTSVTLDLTHSCNFRCWGCIEATAMLDSGKTSLKADTIYQLLEQLKAMGVKEILFYGGEPTLHPEFPRLVLDAADKQFILRVITNGSQLDRLVIAESIRQAAEKTDVTVRVSLNAGSRATHDQLHRCPGALPHILAGLEAITAGDSQVRLWISFLVQEANAGEIMEGFDIAARAKAKSFAIRPLTGEHGIGLVQLSPKANQAVLAAIEELKPNRRPAQPRVYYEPWYLDYLRTNQLPDLSKPYPACYYCGNSRLIITPPDPGVVWGCTFWRGDRRFKIASLAEYPLGSPEFEKQRIKVVRQIVPGRDCAEVFCNRNQQNQAIWSNNLGNY